MSLHGSVTLDFYKDIFDTDSPLSHVLDVIETNNLIIDFIDNIVRDGYFETFFHLLL